MRDEEPAAGLFCLATSPIGYWQPASTFPLLFFFFSFFTFTFFVLLLPSSATFKAKLFIFYYFLRQEFFFERPSANTCLWKHTQFPFSPSTRLGCHISGFKLMQCHYCNSHNSRNKQCETNLKNTKCFKMQHGDHCL